YVTGFEFLNDISCVELKSQNDPNNEIFYSYDWIIKNFQDFYPVSPSFIKSDRFYSPVQSNLQHTQGNYFGWRLYIIPNDGLLGGQLSVGLTAIQTDFEKKDIEADLTKRSADHDFELFVNYTGKYKPVWKSKRFTFNKHSVSSEVSRFNNTKIIFPDNDKTIKVDLIVRVNFYKNNLAIESPPDFMSEQYFNDEVFSDIVFTFRDNSTIKASSMFLATKSLHFKKLLGDTRKDASKIIIKMDGFAYDSFYRLLHYIYTGKLDDDLNFEELCDLYNEANLREIHDLKKLLCCRIIDFVDENNLDILFMLGVKTKNNVLKNAVLKFSAIGHTVIES
ncbi:19510_t:CDS:1, partial [Funneliformis geosporum]